MSSKNFPGKPMADILGMPMIGHVYNRVEICNDIDDVYVATSDRPIIDYISKIGGQYIEIPESKISATDRVAEAVTKIEEKTHKKYDLVIIVQPDEPMVTSDMIGRAISPMILNPKLKLTCLMAEITSDEIFNDRNEIKVVADSQNNAMYFSREPIPSSSRGMSFPRMKLVGIDVMRRKFLQQFNLMINTPLEVAEGIDLNRILENGIKIAMTLTDQVTYSVGTPKDLAMVQELMKDDYMIRKYMK
jgi:3-deoxy-manno-octulosonate cytidylyltransferase (CMP-KDO synthetase)